MIIIILLTSAKRGQMLINLSGCLGTSGFGNSSHFSICVRQWSFLGSYQALKWQYDRAYVYRPGMVSRAVCERGIHIPLLKYSNNTQFKLGIIVDLDKAFNGAEVGPPTHIINSWPKAQMDVRCCTITIWQLFSKILREELLDFKV